LKYPIIIEVNEPIIKDINVPKTNFFYNVTKINIEKNTTK